MARFYYHDCSACGKKTSQKLVGYDDDGNQMLECETNAHKNTKVPAQVSKRKTTWPYYNESCGVTFESESHEKKFATANKLEKI